jgi:hypothetical protein
MPVELTPHYKQKLSSYYENHPDHLAAVHRAHLGGLGLSEEGLQEIVKSGDPGLAHHPALGAIGARPKSEHAQAVAALHEAESSGPNSKTDAYLMKRGKLAMPPRERRSRLVR